MTIAIFVAYTSVPWFGSLSPDTLVYNWISAVVNLDPAMI